VNVCPATINVPVRAAPVFAAAVNAVAPDPVPEAPDVIVIQGVVVLAVQAHVGADAVTATDPDPPVSGTL
jgi:hypothetical protein